MFWRRKGELELPADVHTAKKAKEVLRVWEVGDGVRYIMRASAWRDPACWGVLIADLARHAANAFSLETGAEIFDRIVAGLRAELDFPTGNPEGQLER